MPHKIRLSDEALRQITAIGDYIAQDSRENALRWTQRLRTTVDTLSNIPERYAVLYTAAEAGREVHQMFFWRLSHPLRDPG